jgi:hypothetical protein
VAENPFRYTSDSDRQIGLADLLFDLLAPDTPVRPRALSAARGHQPAL